MNPYLEFVTEFVKNMERAARMPHAGFPPLPRPPSSPTAGTVMLVSPHPDDECIVGALPLRLAREAGMRVVNVALTQGSKKERQAARFCELEGACDYLGFDLIQVQEGGLEAINLKGKTEQPANWEGAVERVAEIMGDRRPEIVLIPHPDDANTTHTGAHHLTLEAMGRLGPAFQCHVVETEFWAPLAAPNLMIEVGPECASELIAALTFHVGEISRNPYHLTLLSWMNDNVRRGGELVGEQGGAPPDFPFAVLYRVRLWQNGALVDTLGKGECVPTSENVGRVFR